MIFTSCSYTRNVRILTQGKILREGYIQNIPFDMRKDIIVIKAAVNADSTPREFIFDTGAFNSKIESHLATSLNLEVVAEKNNSTAQGISQHIEVVRIDTLTLGQTKIYSFGAGKLTYGATSASPCIAPHGIIGGNVIKLAHWKIDYENQQMYFSDAPFSVPASSYTVSFKRPALSATPKISFQVEDKTIDNVMVDVGYNGALVLPIALAQHFSDHPSTVILDRSISGIYGVNTDSIVVKHLEVDIAGGRFTIPVEFSSLNKALLGNAFLKHFTLTIDNEDNQISLKQNRPVRIESPQSFSIGIEDDSTWVVNRTIPHHPLALGDKLRSVNGKKPAEVFSSHCDYIKQYRQQMLSQGILKLEQLNGKMLEINVND